MIKKIPRIWRKLTSLHAQLGFLFAGLLIAISFVSPSNAQQIPALMVIPPTAASAQPSLVTQRAALEQERSGLRGRAASLNSACAGIDSRDTGKIASCTKEKQELQAAMNFHIQKSEAFNSAVNKTTQGCNADNNCTIKAMNALAKRLGWSVDQQTRFNKAISGLFLDRDPNSTEFSIRRAWEDILKRDQDGAIARAAAQSDGPGYPGAGTQTSFQDCAVFALANAAGVPYGVVAARATDFIRQGEWRTADERTNPQNTIEKRGLNGGEVVMVADALGRAQVIEAVDFSKTLKGGRRILINVVPETGDGRSGHEVVLTKTFRHNGETWFEMMDSYQGPVRRLYLSAKELTTIHKENGVAYSPNPGETPKLLR
jgi:hypothetical protein